MDSPLANRWARDCSPRPISPATASRAPPNLPAAGQGICAGATRTSACATRAPCRLMKAISIPGSAHKAAMQIIEPLQSFLTQTQRVLALQLWKARPSYILAWRAPCAAAASRRRSGHCDTNACSQSNLRNDFRARGRRRGTEIRTKSLIVKSISCPPAETTGNFDCNGARDDFLVKRPQIFEAAAAACEKITSTRRIELSALALHSFGNTIAHATSSPAPMSLDPAHCLEPVPSLDAAAEGLRDIAKGRAGSRGDDANRCGYRGSGRLRAAAKRPSAWSLSMSFSKPPATRRLLEVPPP